MDNFTGNPTTINDSDQAEGSESHDNHDNVQGLGFCVYYIEHGHCLANDCPYVHGELCPQCGAYCLDPHDERQRQFHHAQCALYHQLKQDPATVLAISRNKTCCICLEVVLEKVIRKRRFGILPNCRHTFCLSCIRSWRKSDAASIKRTCPVCRTRSDFIFPSYFWIEDEKEKRTIIACYKNGCSLTDCKHFNKGAGVCPFGQKCFYRHALPSGELVKRGTANRHPKQKRHRVTDSQMSEPPDSLWQLSYDSFLWDE